MTSTTSFFRFLLKRQNIWENRFVFQKASPPYTSDKILQTYSFDNCYRDLDRTTLYVINNISRNHRARRLHLSLIFSVITFRFFNSPWTYLVLAEHMARRSFNIDLENIDLNTTIPHLMSPQDFDAREAISALDYELAHDVTLLRKAYTISSHVGGMPTHVFNINKILAPLATSGGMGLLADIANAKSAKEAFYAIRKIPCCGDFMSYEVLCDLLYSDLWNFSENDFVNLGPGAVRGLYRVLCDRYEDPINDVVELQHRANAYLLKHKFPFYQGRLLSLRSIEHSLCEFDKYQRMKEYQSKTGLRAHLRKFNPSSDESYLKMLNAGPLDDLYKKWRTQYPGEFV